MEYFDFSVKQKQKESKGNFLLVITLFLMIANSYLAVKILLGE
jgi:hypothetical protein